MKIPLLIILAALLFVAIKFTIKKFFARVKETDKTLADYAPMKITFKRKRQLKDLLYEEDNPETTKLFIWVLIGSAMTAIGIICFYYHFVKGLIL